MKYEYHGWITLEVTPSSEEVDNEFDLLWNIHKLVSNLLEDFCAEHRIAGLKVVNGQHLIWIAGCTNHENYESKELLNLLKSIGKYAPGSYGILYVHNDEDTEGLSNEFQVWRLVRGNLEKQKDYYLSPCVPVIEDA